MVERFTFCARLKLLVINCPFTVFTRRTTPRAETVKRRSRTRLNPFFGKVYWEGFVPGEDAAIIYFWGASRRIRLAPKAPINSRVCTNLVALYLGVLHASQVHISCVVQPRRTNKPKQRFRLRNRTRARIKPNSRASTEESKRGEKLFDLFPSFLAKRWPTNNKLRAR